MKAVRVSRGKRGSSVQTRSAIVGVSSRWAAISAAGISRQEARRGFWRRAETATTGFAMRRALKLRRWSGVAGRVGGIDPDPVDLARGDGDERDRLRVDEDGLGKSVALGTRKALRVVEFREKIPARAGGEPPQVEENPRGHDRASQARAPYLVDACDQANATSAVVGKEGRIAHGVRLFKPTENRHP
jgi:hypothetical protein